MLNSLDPRVNRLPTAEFPEKEEKPPLDQFGTFEVFVHPKEGKPFQHEGIVHAPNLEMAYILAKEAFTRRFLCVSLYVVDTRHVAISSLGDGSITGQSNEPIPSQEASPERYEIYHLIKRGKQHVHAGSVEAVSPERAIAIAGTLREGNSVCSVWAIRSGDIRYTSSQERDLWHTLPDKKFRDAADYKGGEKLKKFLQNRVVRLDE